MNIMERRRRVDLAIAACNGHTDARQKLDDLFRDAERAAETDMRLLAAALVAIAGGDVTVPPHALAGIEVGGGFFIEEELQTGGMRVRVMTSLPATLAIVAAEAESRQQPPAAAPPAHVPPANPDEPDGDARARICGAIKTFVNRHYDGEIHRRGFAFLETVMGELLAMAVGVALANDPDPDHPMPHLSHIAEQLVPRVQHYQHLIEELKAAAPQPEPGEPAKTHPPRLM